MNLHLTTTVYSIKKINTKLTELIIHSPRLIKTIDIGEFIKLQNYHREEGYLSEPVALTPVYLDYKNDLVYFIIKERGASSRILSNLIVGEKVVTMGAVGEKFPMEIFKNKKVLVICDGFRHYLNLFLMEKVFDDIKTAKITLVSDDFNRIDGLYRERLSRYSHELIDCNGDKSRLENFVEHQTQNFDCIILGLKDDNLKKHIYQLPATVIDLRNAIMQCMMNGVCCRCVQQDAKGKNFFACGKSRYFIHDRNTVENRKISESNLIEKISYLKAQKLII